MAYKDPERQRAYQIEFMRKRRLAWLEENGPCQKCGSWENLEVDHIDPKLKISHRIWSRCAEFREKELAKCQVLCGGCHQEKTSRQQGEHLVHGMESMYNKRGCRCDLCRKANTDKSNAWRWRTGRRVRRE